MKMKNHKIILLLIAISSFSFAFGQQDEVLMNYIDIALKSNPMVKQKFAEYEASLQLVPQVGSLPDPELNVGVFLTPMELLGGSQLADIRLMQMFPWFGTLKYAKDEMSLMAKAKFESFRESKYQVMYDVQQSWFDLYKAQKGIEISQKNLEILTTLERLSLIKFKTASISGVSSSSANTMQNSAPAPVNTGGGMSGMSGNTSNNQVSSNRSMGSSSMGSTGTSGLADLYRIQIEISDLENDIALLKSQKKTISARFNHLLNRNSEELIKMPDTLIANVLTLSVEKVGDSMLVHNPMLTMLNYEKQSLDARKEMVTRMGYPMLGVGVNYALNKKNPMSTLEMNGEDMIMPMITVTLPIYRKKYKAMQKEVEHIKSATEYQYQETANNLKTAYYEAIQNYEDTKRRIDLYAKQFDLANQSLRILIKSYSGSGVGLTDLLLLQQQTLNYELLKIQAVADHNNAIAKLQQLMSNSQLQ